MDAGIIWNSGVMSVAEQEMHEQPSAGILDEIDLNRIDGKQSVIVSALLACLIIYPCVISGDDENVVIHEQKPDHFLKEFGCGHQVIRFIENILHC